MKRILILSFYFPPDLCAGSFRTKALIDSLEPLANAAHIQIDVITTSPNRYANFHVEARADEKMGCVTIHRIKIPNHHSGFIDQAKAFSHYFFKSLKITKHQKYDLVYATSSRLFTAFLGARIATKKHVPLFLDIRDIFTDTMQSILKFPLRVLIPFFNGIERYTIRKASVLNVVSQGFLPYFKPKKNCEILTSSHGIDKCFQKIQQNHVRENRLIKRVLYAGNIGKGQGIEKIIPALAYTFKDQCEFHIIGSGGQQKALNEACCDLTNVKIFPPVDRQTLIRHYQESDILFLHLNDFSAFRKVLPSKIFEYVMAGKPILAGLSGYSADFLSNNVSGCWIFPPCDVTQATNQLKQILMHPSKIEDRDQFYEKFNREKIMRELSEKIILYT